MLLSSVSVIQSQLQIPSEELITSSFADLNYLAFGDSVTEGGNLEDRSDAYPGVTADLLGCNVVNKAVGGSTFVRDPNNTARHCIAEDVINLTKQSGRYHIISVAGGVNDQSLALPLGSISDPLTTETIYGSLKLIAKTLIQRYPNAFIFFITPIKYPESEIANSKGYDLSDVAKAIKAVGAKYDLPVLDLYNTSQFETASNGMNHPDCDGWHPLKEFVAEYMAPQVAVFIRDNYEMQTKY